ncbi:Xaa-Pro dipeptidase [Halomonas sp. Bachu 37]|uniref:Xaa-Pro dipeptidase n=1 Tax=Halomonas kashgarensis TaxID=3084920 RepID=UPI00321647E5
MLDTLHTLHQQHLDRLQTAYAELLNRHGYDAVILYSGHSTANFADDQHPSFATFGHFMHWLPMAEVQHSWLVIQPGQAPRLVLHAPADFWHSATVLPDEPWVSAFTVEYQASPGLPTGLPRRLAAIGDIPDAWATKLGADNNPVSLVTALDELRMVKDEYEIACLREANRLAMQGHLAAAEAFHRDTAELDIQLAYLGASRQRESAVPYQNIVGLNQHGGVLHYQHYELDAPAARRSLLVDAGRRYRGYCADITRTHAGNDAPDDFSALIQSMHGLKDDLINAVKPGVDFIDLHLNMHQQLGNILLRHGLISGSAESAVETGITRAFCPHGLGHSLGLQVHDVAGLRHPDGSPSPAPPQHPALRLTRELTPGMVVTIEPGLYFIPMLLEPLRNTQAGGLIQWEQVQRLAPCGGIRIEDNIAVTAHGRDNLTA